MGTMTFLLPAGLDGDTVRDLERACVSGGPDNMPWLTQARIESGRLVLQRAADESGNLAVPWPINGFGRLMGFSATLMERPQPYDLVTELARGKVNQVRCQALEWRAGGLNPSEVLARQIRDVSLAFGRSVTQGGDDAAGAPLQPVLDQAYLTAQELVRAYVEHAFEDRHQRQAILDTTLGCRLGPLPPGAELTGELLRACNSVSLPLPWSQLEPSDGNFRWQAADALLDWAAEHELAATLGPLIEFTTAGLPDWLWGWERDLGSLAAFLTRYVTTAVKRYGTRVRRWQITAASNCTAVLHLNPDELLWLTVKAVEAARQADPGLELSVGIAQPWGECLAADDRHHSPFLFADTLIRSGLNLAALDLEVIMGVAPRGSYCRDLLEMSRLLDLYALLGVPLRVTLGYPSAEEPDVLADAELQIAAGRWRDGFSPPVQANWGASFAELALAKSAVEAVQWVHLSDAEPHAFPHCGLVDAAGNVKPALQGLSELREEHLR
jgi:hypothetical protein